MFSCIFGMYISPYMECYIIHKPIFYVQHIYHYVYLCAMIDEESFTAQHYLILPLWLKLLLIGRFPFFKFKYKRYILFHLCSRFISPSLCSQLNIKHIKKANFSLLFQRNSFFRLPFTSKLHCRCI